MIRAVIFDLDGVLVDSEPNYFESDRRVLADLGVVLSDAQKRGYVGRSAREMLGDLVLLHDIRESIDTLVARMDAAYLELARRSTPVFPESLRLLRRLRAAGYPLALASGSAAPVIDVVLAGAGIRDCFDVVLSADVVARGKPAPDLFLLAAERLGIAAEACVVIEDSSPGVRAAVAAGMRCVAIPYLSDPPLEPAFATADLLVEAGMDGLVADDVFAWITSGAPPADSRTPGRPTG